MNPKKLNNSALDKRIALVTGANRGIGKEICRQLAKQGLVVLLTARNQEKGLKTCSDLQHEGYMTEFIQVDVTDTQHIVHARTVVENRFGRLDVLINNAAVFFSADKNAIDVNDDLLLTTLETNLIGPLRLTQAFIPLMRKNQYGRVVNISSGLGALRDMGGGYPAYRISKTALNALTRVIAAELSGTNILVNTMCPGWVKTDMGGKNASRSVEKGAETAVWLACLADNGPTGEFFRDKHKIDW